MTCLVWRQHRGQLLLTGVFLVALCGFTVLVGRNANHWLAGYHGWVNALRAAGCPSPGQRGVVKVHASCHALLQRYPHGMQETFATTYNFAIPAFEEGI